MMNRLQALGVAYGAVAHEFEVMSDRLVGSSTGTNCETRCMCCVK